MSSATQLETHAKVMPKQEATMLAIWLGCTIPSVTLAKFQDLHMYIARYIAIGCGMVLML